MRDKDFHDEGLPQIEQMNNDVALELCGSREALLSVLKTVAESGPDRIDSIQEAFRSGDFERYRMEMHTLKGMTASIGCTLMHDLAAELEKRAKIPDISFITDNHDRILRDYMELAGSLELYFSERERENSTDRRKIAPEMLLGILSEAESALSDYEDTTAEERLRYLLLCDIPEEVEKEIKHSLTLLDLFSFDDACTVVQSMKQMVCAGA